MIMTAETRRKYTWPRPRFTNKIAITYTTRKIIFFLFKKSLDFQLTTYSLLSYVWIKIHSGSVRFSVGPYKIITVRCLSHPNFHNYFFRKFFIHTELGNPPDYAKRPPFVAWVLRVLGLIDKKNSTFSALYRKALEIGTKI
jgi:hypothetical protein